MYRDTQNILALKWSILVVKRLKYALSSEVHYGKAEVRFRGTGVTSPMPTTTNKC